MPSLGLIIGLTAAGAIGAIVCSYLPYLAAKSGRRVSEATRWATILTSAFMALSVLSLASLLLTSAGPERLSAGVGLLSLCLLYMLAQYLAGPFILVMGTKKAEKDPSYRWVADVVRRVAAKAGYRKRIDVRIANLGVPNAFTTGNIIKRFVVVSRELLHTLDPDELEAVIAHEIGHLAHHDVPYLIAVSFVPTMIYLIGLTYLMYGQVCLQLAASPSLGRDGEARAQAGLQGIFAILIGLAIIALAIPAMLSILAFNRTREILADLHAVKTTKSDALARALDKISKSIAAHPKPLRLKLRNLLYIVPQLDDGPANPLTSLLGTHPPVPIRILLIKKYLAELQS